MVGNVLNRTTKEYIVNVEMDNYPAEDWIHDPDMSEVDLDWPRYWVIDGDTVSEMTLVDQQALDAPGLVACVTSKIQQLDKDIETYVDTRYPTRRLLNFLMLHLEAVDLSYTNRKTYLAQLRTWVKSVTAHFYTARNALMGMTTFRQVEAYDFNLTQFDVTDPLVAVETAIAMED